MNEKMPCPGEKGGELPAVNNEDYEINMRLLVDKLLDTDYDFLGMIDALTGYLMVFGKNRDVNGMARNGGCYDEEMPRVFRELLPESYYEEGVRTMERAHVIEELEHRDHYICSFPVRIFGGLKAGQKQWKFSYLDSSRSHIWITRTDITNVYTVERDSLTGLYNQQGFYLHVREILDANPGRKFVLLRCDIDRFKAYNDVCGTIAGDKLLTDFGRAIRSKTWPDLSVFARLEADHFCVLYPQNELDVEEWGAIHASWLSQARPGYRLTSSIGIYEIIAPSIDISLMCDRALLALRTVKDSYNRKIARYDENLRRRLMAEQALVDDMEQALDEGQFLLYFQPQISYSSKALVGAEVLVRWNHPKLGLILPGEFIPLFEKNGFILRLDMFVWEKSCQYLHDWIIRNPGKTPVSLSVNISRHDIYDQSLCEIFGNLIRRYSLLPEYLRLEITETAYMENPEQLIGVVKELRSMGFMVEMDDFGSGYSSLNMLKDVPVDVLKLDIRFLSSGEENIRGGQILYSVIRMAHWLKLPVIAEGVETAAQADYLKSLNCVYMQGFYFSRPLPEAGFEQYMQKLAVGRIELAGGDTGYDANALWDPATRESVLFNRFASGTAILEYRNGNAEIIRANDLFYVELETTRDEYMEKQYHTFFRFSEENRKIYRDMLDQAVRTGAVAGCVVQSLPQNSSGRAFWTHNSVRVLSRVEDYTLLCLTVENVTDHKELEEQLASQKKRMELFSQQELRNMGEQSGMMVYRYHMKTRTLERLFESQEKRNAGFSVQEDIPDFSVRSGLISPDTAEAYIHFFEQMAAGVPHGSGDVKMMVGSREYRWHHADYTLVYDENGKPVYALITAYDDTEERKRRAAAENWRASLSLLMADAVLYAEVNLRRNKVLRMERRQEPEGAEEFAETFEDLTRCGICGEMSEDAANEYKAFFDRHRLLGLFNEGVTEDHYDYGLWNSDGAQTWIRVSVKMIRHSADEDVTAAIAFTNLSEQKKELERLSRQVRRDALTGILNREGLEKKAEELYNVFDPRKCTALFMLDLDNFKQVNDRLGHQMGDIVLRQAADSIQKCFYHSEAVGRIGGDEFMVLLSGDLTTGFLEEKAKDLLNSMEMNIGENEQVPISISIGIAYGWGQASFEKMYRIADIALYSAKRAGKRCFHMINADTSAGRSYSSQGGEMLSLQSLISCAGDQQLELRQSPYEALIDSMPGGVIVITLDTRMRLTHCNSWLADQLGYGISGIEKLQEDNPLALVHPDDISSILEITEKVRGGLDVLHITYRLRAVDGKYRHVCLNTSLTERSENKAIFYGIQTDVDDLMRLQEELGEANKRQAALINAIPGGLGVFELTDTTKITYYGSWIYEYTGYSPEELDQERNGPGFGSIWHEDLPRINTVLQEIRQGKNKASLSIRMRCKDGKPKPVHLSGSVIDRSPEKITMYTIYTAPDYDGSPGNEENL